MKLDTVQAMEQAFSMQMEFINLIRRLINYDKAVAEKNRTSPENTKVLDGFCDTQEKALEKALVLLHKHKDALLALEKKRAEQEKQKNKKKAEEQRKQAKTESTDTVPPKNTADDAQESLFGEDET